MAKNFRLYIKEPLAPGKTIILEEEQTHYLKNVVKYTYSKEETRKIMKKGNEYVKYYLQESSKTSSCWH